MPRATSSRTVAAVVVGAVLLVVFTATVAVIAVMASALLGFAGLALRADGVLVLCVGRQADLGLEGVDEGGRVGEAAFGGDPFHGM